MSFIEKFRMLRPRRNRGRETLVEVPPQRDPRADAASLPTEIGGYDGPEPTRFGDWEHKGRCSDF